MGAKYKSWLSISIFKIIIKEFKKKNINME